MKKSAFWENTGVRSITYRHHKKMKDITKTRFFLKKINVYLKTIYILKKKKEKKNFKKVRLCEKCPQATRHSPVYKKFADFFFQKKIFSNFFKNNDYPQKNQIQSKISYFPDCEQKHAAWQFWAVKSLLNLSPMLYTSPL